MRKEGHGNTVSILGKDIRDSCTYSPHGDNMHVMRCMRDRWTKNKYFIQILNIVMPTVDVARSFI